MKINRKKLIKLLKILLVGIPIIIFLIILALPGVLTNRIVLNHYVIYDPSKLPPLNYLLGGMVVFVIISVIILILIDKK